MRETATLSDRYWASRPLAAAPVGGASKIAEPARNQFDLGVAVQRRIECDVVTGWVDVS
jgi:hypothetical protein